MKRASALSSLLLVPSLLAQGTLVLDLAPGGGSAGSGLLFGSLAPLGDHALFSGDSGTGLRLFRSDGTPAGTNQVLAFAPGGPAQVHSFTVLGDLVVFVGTNSLGAGLWRSDGTPTGTYPLTAIVGNAITHLTSFRGQVWFQVSTPTGAQLWHTDGTVGGTQMLMPIPAPYIDPPQFCVFDDHLLFPVRIRGAFGFYELWKTDGTPTGTTLVRQFLYALAEPRDFTVYQGAVFFTVDEPGLGRELWRTDGTTAGTALFADLTPGPNSTRPDNLQVLASGSLLFTDLTGGFGPPPRLWVTDGTLAGTQILFASSNEQVVGLRSVGSLAYFAIGGQLGMTDGTAAGTFLFPLPVRPGDLAHTGARLGSGDHLVFRGADWNAFSDTELWITDQNGPALLATINPGPAGSLPASFTRAGNRLFFIADDGTTGRELHALPLAATGAWVAESFGRGCGLGSQPPTLSAAGQATLGQTSNLVLAGAEPNAPAFLLWSTARTSLPLGGGCTAHLASLDLFVPRLTDALGHSLVALPIPNQPNLVGASLYFQDVVLAANAPLFGLAELSSALEFVFGP